MMGKDGLMGDRSVRCCIYNKVSLLYYMYCLGGISPSCSSLAGVGRYIYRDILRYTAIYPL